MRTILHSGKIYQEKGKFCEALLIEDGVITKTGSSEKILMLYEDGTDIIDLMDSTVVPGFNDSHLHFYYHGVTMASVNVYGSTSVEEVIEKGRDYLRQHPHHSGYLWGRGWNQNQFVGEKRMLTKDDIDKISVDIPIVLGRACGHVAVCNSKALELANINESGIVEGGEILVGEDGLPNGLFTENAIDLLECLKPRLTVEDVKKQIEQIAKIANQRGITSVSTNDLHMGDENSKIIEQAYVQYASERPTVRINHQICYNTPEILKASVAKGFKSTDFLRYGPLKIFTDGSLGARTALMRTPYADDVSTRGIACMTPEQIDEYVQTATDLGMQVVAHAIGDGAMENVLNAYAKVIDLGKSLRHGIIHCQITDHDILQRMSDLDVLALVQPIFLHADLHIVEDRVGKQLASSSYAFKTMEDLGIHVSYGSDAPVEDFNVFEGIHCAVNRQDLMSYPSVGYNPKEKVDVFTAIDNYTVEGAYASFEEQQKGRLMTGHFADLIVLSDDIFTIPTQEIKELQVLKTMVHGVFV
ncbi:MAG: amidohydrolase [Erysipelotrichaceae bacterium]|nr:amidohydrolase [Erysipelotrichaceae bacterium]